jgi:carbamoyltransferase
MLVAGVNSGVTRSGRPLKDGGACLLKDGKVIVAVAEERLSRQKHAGGFSRALDYCLSAASCSISDVDMVVVSTCAERPLEDGCDIGLFIAPNKIRAMPSHHLSHAYGAFFTSPFDEAVIMVVDNEGNTVGDREDTVYWNNRVERNSYYIGSGDRIQLLHTADDCLDDQELGPGEAYRHFTYFLGWHSYVYAGKTMGLAPYGHRESFGNLRVFDLSANQIRSLLRNGRESPPKAVADLAREQGVIVGPARMPNEQITQRHCDVAAVIQDELERALIFKAQALYERTGIKKLCLAGGIALNCVANRKILNKTPFENLYVCSAPGDSGQCIGNALYGWMELAGRPRPVAPFKPCAGRRYRKSELTAALAGSKDRVTWARAVDVARDAAHLVANGHVIGWFQGRSELGPRALGARSILADPRQSAMRDYLNLVVKRREPFRPYAPSILQSERKAYFDLSQDSPFMELTGVVAPQMRHRIPAVTHVDGSARPHTVADSDGIFADLIRAFRKLSGIPLMLNTSFNLGGEPIVESPADAIECFLRSELDVLVMHDFIVRREEGSLDPRFFKWAASMPPSA